MVTARSRVAWILVGLFAGWMLMSAMVWIGTAAADTPDAGVLVDAGSRDPLTELGALKAAYDALKANQDPSVSMLLWAGVLAAGLKLALSGFMRLVYKETKSWTRWVALASAVPIALLSHFALGNGWFASLVYAGAGPGSIVVHELLAALTKKKVEA